MANYINYSELTEEQKEDLIKQNRAVLNDINDYLETHKDVTYGELYDILGVPCSMDMRYRPIDGRLD